MRFRIMTWLVAFVVATAVSVLYFARHTDSTVPDGLAGSSVEEPRGGQSLSQPGFSEDPLLAPPDRDRPEHGNDGHAVNDGDRNHGNGGGEAGQDADELLLSPRPEDRTLGLLRLSNRMREETSREARLAIRARIRSISRADSDAKVRANAFMLLLLDPGWEEEYVDVIADLRGDPSTHPVEHILDQLSSMLASPRGRNAFLRVDIPDAGRRQELLLSLRDELMGVAREAIARTEAPQPRASLQMYVRRLKESENAIREATSR